MKRKVNDQEFAQKGWMNMPTGKNEFVVRATHFFPIDWSSIKTRSEFMTISDPILFGETTLEGSHIQKRSLRDDEDSRLNPIVYCHPHMRVMGNEWGLFSQGDNTNQKCPEQKSAAPLQRRAMTKDAVRLFVSCLGIRKEWSWVTPRMCNSTAVHAHS